MRYPSPEEIQTLKSRGYDRTLLDERASRERWDAVCELREQIRAAFRGVSLGRGVGLRQGCALDDWQPPEVCQQRREDDEKDDWGRICSEDLFRYECMSFLDAEGFRFHLPAYMLDDLDGGGAASVVRHLTDFSILGTTRLELLSGSQRDAVCAFLNFMRDDPDHFRDRDAIDAAMDSYWRVPIPEENQEGEQAVAPNRSLPPTLKSTSSVRGSED
ncbi:MAG: DUF6714 family protein [Verrucomicrobiota bacterium]